MYPFRYTTVPDTTTAITTVAPEEQAVYIAGGTSLLDLMKLNVQTPAHLVDINALPLDNVEVHTDYVRIGALARNSDVAYHPTIRERYPLLAQALLGGASPQLRNMATIGGNLLQRTRCPYFRETASACNKREPGSGCSAFAGNNRGHVVFGGSVACVATHPSDMAVALSALDAVVLTSGPHGARRLPLADFYLLPEQHPERETLLEHGELITAVELPASSVGARSHYLKVRDRASYAFALVSVAVTLRVTAGQIQAARLVLGGVAPLPWRAYQAEQGLLGQPAVSTTYQLAAETALQDARPLRENGFKIPLAKNCIVRALTIVGGL